MRPLPRVSSPASVSLLLWSGGSWLCTLHALGEQRCPVCSPGRGHRQAQRAPVSPCPGLRVLVTPTFILPETRTVRP